MGCRGCWWVTCLGCGECFDFDFDDGEVGEEAVGIEHVCKEEENGKSREDEFLKGLKKGKDYQICPNDECRRIVELADGCKFFPHSLLSIVI